MDKVTKARLSVYPTVILHFAVFLPSTVVTVINAVPFLIPLTTPLLETAATWAAELFHETRLSLAFAGPTTTKPASASTLPRPSTAAANVAPEAFPVLVNLTEVTGWATFTTQVALMAPSRVVTVICARPGASALTFPVDETLAIFILDEDQVKSLFVAFVG